MEDPGRGRKNDATANSADKGLEVIVIATVRLPYYILAILIALFLIVFLLNLVVGQALYRARRLKPVLRVLLLNLAISDSAVGIINCYHVIFNWFIRDFTIECIIRYSLVLELMIVSLFLMVVLSLDRVIALAAALRYDELVTTQRLWAVSVLVWLGSLLFTVAGLVGVDMNNKHCLYQLFMPPYSFFMYGSFGLMVVAVIVALNAFTLSKTLGHIQQIAKTVVVVATVTKYESSSSISHSNKESRVAAMNQKAAVTSLFVVVPFVVLCSPIYILLLVFYFLPGLTKTLAGLVAITVCLGLVITNSLLNPFIYVWRATEVRAEVKRSFRLRDANYSLPTPEISRQQS